MRLSKKKESAIKRLSVFDKHLGDYVKAVNSTDSRFWDYPPDRWTKDEVALFDLVTSIEDDLKSRILKVIKGG